MASSTLQLRSTQSADQASADSDRAAHSGAAHSDPPPVLAHPSPWMPRARIALTAFVALMLLPMLGLAALAFAGVLDSADLQAMTPAVMLLPALVAIFVWSLTRPMPLGQALRVTPERGWLRAIGWSVAALVLVAALGAATAGLAALLGIAQPATGWLELLPAVPAVLGTMLALSLGEEVGWRGFAQRLLAPVGLVRASLAIAAFWALWHAPVMAVLVWEGTMPLAVAVATLGGLLLGGLALSALSALGGSVLPAVVGHAAMSSLVVVVTGTVVAGAPIA